MPRATQVHRIAMASPDDVSGIRALIGAGEIDPSTIIAILGKTEGNGCVNDFTRGYAVQSLRLLLLEFIDTKAVDQVCLIMSGGTEGAMSPHWIVISVVEAAGTSSFQKALAAAQTITRPLLPAEIGRLKQADLVADAVRSAMTDAAIESAQDVHFVQIKCPLLTAERIEEAGGPGAVSTTSTLKSMGTSRGASALGVAIALDELDRSTLSDAMIGNAPEHYSSRASCSAGIELLACEVLVLGMSDAWSGSLAIDHTVMEDGIDLGSVHSLLSRNLGAFEGQLSPQQSSRVKAVLVKAEASQSGQVRGQRHTMLDDSDISSTRHARGFIAGLLGGATGLTDLFVSGGAEHQGPDGGGPCALIFERT
ncbi:MAG: ring-opening amidohydrolase [Pseudomonadota bacterium]